MQVILRFRPEDLPSCEWRWQALEQAACAHQEEIALLQQQFEDVVIQARRQHEHHHRQQQLSMQGKQQEREQALGWKREKGKMELKLQAITVCVS